MRTKKFLALALSLGMVLSLTACGGSTSAPATEEAPAEETAEATTETTEAAEGEFAGSIKLGVIGPMTGSLAVYGTHIANGVAQAVSEINAAGGVSVNGEMYSLETSVQDDTGDSTECLNAMNALISDGVGLVIGSATSGCTSAITSVANSENVTLITPSGTADALTTEMDFVFRTCFRDSFQGELAAQYAKDEGMTKVGIVYCNADTYSAGLKDAFTASCGELGIEIVAEESVATMTEVDYTNQFNKMVAAGAELVFTPFYYDVMGPYLVPQARSVGFTGTLLGCDGVDNTETTIPDGQDLTVYEGLMFVNHYATELATSEVSSKFVENFVAMYGETPNNFDALGYDAVLVYKQAIEAAGSADPTAVQAALADTSVVYDCASGTFSFDETGTPVKTGVLMGYAVEDGAIAKKAIKTLSVN